MTISLPSVTPIVGALLGVIASMANAAPSVDWMRVTPGVIRDDIATPITLTAKVTDANFAEMHYLAANPDVARAVAEGTVESGRKHFDAHHRGSL